MSIQMQRRGTQWAVTRDGETVASGLTMVQARALYAELIRNVLPPTRRRKVFFR